MDPALEEVCPVAQRRVTLADVAARAGVSKTTVSFVLNDRPNTRISETTAARVRAAAAELGYRVDPTARGLRTGRSLAVGFVSDEVTLTRYASPMIRGLLDAGAQRDHVVIMTETDNRPDLLEESVRVLLARRVDGLLFGLMRARLVQLPDIPRRIPAVVVNGTAQGRAAVLPDEYHGGLTAIEHLLTNGHTRIAFIGRSAQHLDPAVSATIGRRLAGIDAGLQAAGLRFVHEVEGADWEPGLGYAGAVEILENTDVTAILAANDRVALGVYQAAQARGLAIPDDLSVMSFDDEPVATYLRPQLSSVRLPYLEMGRTAMDRLLDSVAAGQARELPSETLVPMPLVERGSVRRLG